MRGKVSSKERKGKFIYRVDFFLSVCLFLSAMKCMSHRFKLCANTFLSAVFFWFSTTRGLQGACNCEVEGPVWLLKKKKNHQPNCVSRFP